MSALAWSVGVEGDGREGVFNTSVSVVTGARVDVHADARRLRVTIDAAIVGMRFRDEPFTALGHPRT
jgi:hypothetical protein